jgi:hypothetical protein
LAADLQIIFYIAYSYDVKPADNNFVRAYIKHQLCIEKLKRQQKPSCLPQETYLAMVRFASVIESSLQKLNEL